MAPPPVPPLVAVSVAVYRRLLRAYPPGFRRAYGPQMVHMFRDQCRVAIRQRGTMGLVVVWVRTLGDFVITATAEQGAIVQGGGTHRTARAYSSLLYAGVWLLLSAAGNALIPLPWSTDARVTMLIALLLIPALPLGFTLVLLHKKRYRAAHAGTLCTALIWIIWITLFCLIAMNSLLQPGSPDNPKDITDWWLLGCRLLSIGAIWFVLRARHDLDRAGHGLARVGT